MFCSRVNNQINPFSKGFYKATKDFAHLTHKQQCITVAASIIMGLATLFLGCIGGFATFKALVDAFKVVQLPKGTNPTADKTDQLGQEVLGEKEELGSKKKNNFNDLPTKELLEKCKGLPLQLMLKLDSNDDDKDVGPMSEEEAEVTATLMNRIINMKELEQQMLLEQVKGNPEKFALVAFGILLNDRYFISHSCKILEQSEWPTPELKELVLPKLLSDKIMENGIAWDNWDSGYVETSKTECFSCRRILVHTRRIFGCGDFTLKPEPMSPYLAKSIGLAIKRAAELHLKELKEQLENGVDKEDIFTGVEVAIGQFVETRFSASMIAPILPYLIDVPGIVSLELSNVGVRNPWDDSLVKNSNGFKDEHAEALLNVFRSQPYLQKVVVNVDGMSEEKRKEFMEEWIKIWENPSRFQQPSPEKLLALTQ